MAVDYEANGVQFRMREIPAGEGVESFFMAETEVTSHPGEYRPGADNRAIRGGCWYDHAGNCTVSGRPSYPRPPNFRIN